MNDMFLEGPLADLREREIRLLHEIGDVLGRLSPEGEADRARLRDVANDLRDLFFMIVVMGEFNAGKSSFINALLGDDLLPVGITPTTEVIELIRYGDQPSRKPTTRPDGVREWTHPGIGGPGVVLVDTPGTGSVFRRHEQAARNFLHRSDLVIFMLSAKRAFAETDRLYLELARDYGKKVIVVINQVDLLEPREQAEVRRFVQQQIDSLLGLRPLIFMASARRAREGMPDSGLDAVRAHLNATFAQIPPARQKLLAQLDFAARLMGKSREALDARLALIGRDRDQTSQLQRELEAHAEGVEGRLGTVSGELARVLDGVRQRGMAFIDRNFSVRNFRRALDRAALQDEFESQVVAHALEQIGALTTNYVNGLIDSNRRYWQSIVARLNRLEALLEAQRVAGVDGSVYAEQRLALQEAIAVADAEMSAYSSAAVLGQMQADFQSNLTGLGLSGMGIVGGLLATLTGIAAHVGPLAALEVIGIPILLVGAAGTAVFWQKLRGDVKRNLNARLDALEGSYRQAIVDLTSRERSRLVNYGRQILAPVFSHFDGLAQAAARDLAELDRLEAERARLCAQLDALAATDASNAGDSALG